MTAPVVAPENEPDAGVGVEKNNSISKHPDFRSKVEQFSVSPVETNFGRVDMPDYNANSPFESESGFIKATDAVDMFKDILVFDEQYPKEAATFLVHQFVLPIVREISQLTKQIGEAKDDKSTQLVLRDQRKVASNSLQQVMHDVLISPEAFGINMADFEKSKSELELGGSALIDRVVHGYEHPFRVSGRLLPYQEIKSVISEAVDTMTAPFEKKSGSREVSGHLKTIYVDYLLGEFREASQLGGEKNKVGAMLARQEKITEKMAAFIKDLASEGGVLRYSNAILENTANQLAVDFPRLRLRPAPAIKRDPEKAKAFYQTLVNAYSPDKKLALAEAFKYGGIDASLYDEAGIKQLRHLRVEAEMLMREAGLSEDHISQSWVETFSPVMHEIAGRVQQLTELKKAGQEKNQEAIEVLKKEVSDLYDDIGKAINRRIVNPKLYMMLHPLSGSSPETVIGQDIEVDDENDLEFTVPDIQDRHARVGMFKLFRQAHNRRLEELTNTLGENAKAAVMGSDVYNDFDAARKVLRELVHRVTFFENEDIKALEQSVDDFYSRYDTLTRYVIENFVSDEAPDEL